MIENWLSTDLTQTWLVIVSSATIVVVVIAVARINGLRTFSKMSSFDFAVTVAIGSVIATVAVSATSLLNGVIGVVAIVITQRLISTLRMRSVAFERAVGNDPVLLMAGSRILEDNLSTTGVTVADVRAKLREANVTEWSEVRAVVLETTGDVSVLHGETLDSSLLEDVLDVEELNRGQ